MRMNVLDPFEVFSSPMFRATVMPRVERSRAGFPALNIWEQNDVLHVEAEVPGFAIDNIEITLDDDHLTLKGERKIVTDCPECGDNAPAGEKAQGDQAATADEDHGDSQGDAVFYRREGRTTSFGRVIQLPWEVNSQAITATLDNGVLTVSLPKAEAVKPKKIAVKIGK